MSRELKEIQISVDQLQLGMYVTRLDRPWEETNFVMQGFRLITPSEIDSLVEQCDYVFIEAYSQLSKEERLKFRQLEIKRRKAKKALMTTGKSASPKSKIHARKSSAGPGSDQKPPVKKVEYTNQLPVESEFPAASEAYLEAKATARNIMNDVRLGKTLEINHCRDVVDNVVESILRNSNALVWLSKLKNQDEYTAEHALNVCILSIAFARHLGFRPSAIRRIGLCGLLHDVGKAKIPEEILLKEGRFTAEEFEIMKTHTTHGRDLLLTHGFLDYAVIDVAYSHHERPDNSGYPQALSHQKIPYYAQLVAITDTYDAITSNRCYDKGRSSMEALDIIYKNRGQQFDEDLALEFIKCIGVYPPGSVVEMTNGEVGIVIATNAAAKLRPRVILVLDSDKKPRKEKVIDLLDDPLDKQQNLYVISCELPNGRHGVDIKNYLKRGLKLS